MDGNGSSATLDNIRNDNGSRVALREACRVWLRLAYLGFGGSAYQLAAMRRILVEEKRWISERRFLQALDFCLLLPGPEAQKLATYLGWLMHRTLGGIIAGGLLIAPGVASIMLLSYIYTGLGKLPTVGALLFGLRAALIAIILESLIRIGRRSLRSRAAIALAAAAFIGIFLLAIPFPIIVLSAAALGFVASRAGLVAFQSRQPVELGSQLGPAILEGLFGDELRQGAKPNIGRAFKIAVIWLVLWLLPVDAVAVKFGEANVFSQVATFFSQIAILSFGNSYAVFAYVAQQAVQSLQWLTPGELLAGLGMAQTRQGRPPWPCSSWHLWLPIATPERFHRQSLGSWAACSQPGSCSPLAFYGYSSALRLPKRCATAKQRWRPYPQSWPRQWGSHSASPFGLRSIQSFTKPL